MAEDALDPVAAKQQAIADFARHVNPGKARALAAPAASTSSSGSARGALVKDADGKSYIDCITGFGVFNIGRQHPQAIAAVKGALDSRH